MEEISVKIFQVNGGDVRRFPFQIPKDPKATHQGIYNALLEKVKQIVSINGNSTLQLAWKDDEGDLIIMNTDDEVKEALRHRKGDILRMHVVVVSGSEMPKVEEKQPVDVIISDNVPTEASAKPEKKEEPTDNVHRVICDGCDQNGVQGVRYKCLICRDYDLCGNCEGRRIHDEHPMIRITNPREKLWLPAFMASQGMNQLGFRGGRHGRCQFMEGRQRCGGAHQQAAADTEQQPREQQQQQRQEIPGTQFLRDVGQAVAAVLNGFGIDVDIDVENQDGQRSKVTPPKTEEQQQAPKTEEKKQETVVDQPMEAVASPTPAAETMDAGEKTPDAPPQDWMILEAADATAPQESLQAAGATPAPATAPPASASASVESALAYMTAMGFTNEGGWLTQLLEAKNGDISAVLEILHPSDKP